MKISVAIAGALLVGSAVAGCGGASDNSSSAYCGDIKKADKDFSSLSTGDYSKLDSAFATFHKLADEAPSKIADDWKILDGAITTMQKAFADAGIKFSDLGELQQGKVPEGVDVKKLTQLSTTLSKFNDAKFKTASDNISKHAKSVCKVDITG
ncbi:MAG: hypothetical protein ABIR57_02775 [Aeromicrobium sp.]